MSAWRSVLCRLSAWAGALLFAAMPLHAEMGPRPSRALDGDADARVIVRFKTPLPLDAKRPLQSAAAAGTGEAPVMQAAAVAQALQARAGGLGQRLGLALQAGAAVDERTQVITAHGVGAAALITRLQADPEVELAVVDRRRRIARVPNDPLYQPSPPPAGGPAAGQWYLKPPQAARLSSGSEVLAGIDAQGAWDIATGSSDVVVAVLDTGVRAEHPDLAGKLLPGFDMIDNATVANDGDGRDADASDPGDWVAAGDLGDPLFSDCEEADSSWHGTQVAGLIGAATDNAAGMAGTGWAARVLPVRVLGKCFGYDSDIVAGMRWAAGLGVPGLLPNPNPARVINLSLGDTADSVTPCSQTLYADAVQQVLAAGAVVVAAAGNGTGRAVQPPGNCPGVVTVAGVRHVGTKVGYSNIGPEVTLAAPAGNCVNLSGACLYPILSTSNAGLTTPAGSIYSDGLRYSVGTSFSAPLVAGTAALMLAANPALTPAQVKTLLANTARVFPFRGAPPDDGGAIAQCRAPGTSDQSQCYCNTGTCGAGMLDASWAVYSAAFNAPLPAITLAGGTAVAGQPVVLSGADTRAPSGRSVLTWQWTLIDGGGVVDAFAGGAATAATPTVTLTPGAVGRFSVRLTVADDAGIQGVKEQTVEVVAAPDAGGDGGGALSAPWLAGLALAVLLLRSGRARGHRCRL
ncbi:MAG: S8 family serine peptidase [Pseudomonadota bacterium]